MSWMSTLPPKIELISKPYMVKKAMENTRRYDVFHPSAWGICLRKVAYQYYNEAQKFFKKTPCDVDTRIERVFDNGHGMHARWQSYLDGAGILRGVWKCANPLCGKTYGNDVKVGIFNPLRTIPGFTCSCGNNKKLVYEELLIESEHHYNFEGHCDAVVDIRGSAFARNDDLDLLVVDFKSMKDDEFMELEHAKHEHVVQVHIYMWVLGLQGAIVLYESKDNQKVKEIFVPRNEKIIEQVKEEALWMRDLLDKRKLPPRPDGVSASKVPCRFCEFAKLCYK